LVIVSTLFGDKVRPLDELLWLLRNGLGSRVVSWYGVKFPPFVRNGDWLID